MSITLLISLTIKFQPMNLSSVVSYMLLSTTSDKISWHDKAQDLGVAVHSITRIKFCFLPSSSSWSLSIFLPEGTIKKSVTCLKSIGVRVNTGIKAEPAAYTSSPWKGSHLFGARVCGDAHSSKHTYVQPRACQGRAAVSWMQWGQEAHSSLQ